VNLLDAHRNILTVTPAIRRHLKAVAAKIEDLRLALAGEAVTGQLVNVEFDKIENVKDPLKARMPK